MAADEAWKKRAAVFKPIMDEGVGLYKTSGEEIKRLSEDYAKSEEGALKNLEKTERFLVGVVERAAALPPGKMRKADEYSRRLGDAESALLAAKENKGKAEYLTKLVEEFRDFMTGNNIFLANSVMSRIKNESIGQSLHVVADMSYRMAKNLEAHDKRLASLAGRYATYGRKLEALEMALTGRPSAGEAAKNITRAAAVAKAHRAAP